TAYNTEGLADNMNFDDTVKFVKTDKTSSYSRVVCLLCDTLSMQWDGQQWNCSRCATFFYLPIKPPPYLPRRLSGKKEIKRVCRKCRRIQVFGKRIYCERCMSKRRAQAKRLGRDTMGDLLTGAEELTKPDIAVGYGSGGIPNQAKINAAVMEPLT